VLRELIDLDGIPVHVADTAGIRDTEDVIEAEGVRRARQALETADLVLLIEDLSEPPGKRQGQAIDLPPHSSCLRIGNKIDLLPSGELEKLKGAGTGDRVWISAKTGEGIDALRGRIRRIIGAPGGADAAAMGTFSARQRHIDALRRATDHLEAGQSVMSRSQAGELLAEELRLAQQALGEITGEMLPDDLLAEIFASFCIGK